MALTAGLETDKQKSEQWREFLNRTAIYDAPTELADVIESLREFLMPPVRAVAFGAETISHWQAGGPWCEEK